MKEYVIGKQTFVQSKLTLGKLRCLLVLLSGFNFGDSFTIPGLIEKLSPILPQFFSLILEPLHISEFKTQFPNRELFFEDNLTFDQIIEIFNDFLVLNPFQVALERITNYITKTINISK